MKRLWQKETDSFRYAWHGVLIFFKTEPHARFHALALVLVITLATALKCSGLEFCLLLMAAAIVICTEIVNTAIEKLCDLVHPGQDPRVARIKDMAAGAVLIASIVALAIACFIFIPKLVAWIEN